MENKKIALFVDSENISHKYIDEIISDLASYGEVNIRKAYGDWSDDKLKGWKNELFEYSIEPIHQPPYSTSKNATDIKMTVDIMKVLCQNNKIDYVAIVTSDSDFTPLITEIKSQGIQVLGFGEEKSHKVLQKSCSEFKRIGKKNSDVNDLINDKKLINRLKDAINRKKGDDDFAYLSEVGKYMKDRYSFNASSLGSYKTWGDIFKLLPQSFEIQFRRNNGKNDTMVVKIRR
jgi:uncharacterized protein (TIGR00288 family)